MPTLKDLHTKWKKTKGEAKTAWDALGGLTMNVSVSNVEHGTIAFPKFNKDLGPSLDKLHDKKDVKKWKETADKAVTQYEKDIKAMKESRAKVKVPEVKDPEKATPDTKKKLLYFANVLKLVDVELKALGDVLLEIKKELAKVVVPK